MATKKGKNNSLILGNGIKIAILSVVALLVVAVIVLIIIEAVGKRRVTIYNHTDRNITSLKIMFETEDESEEIMSLYDGALNSGASYKGSFEAIDFSEVSADLGMLVTFEGEDEIFLYDGYFYDRFDGSVDIDFFQADGQYRVKMSATTGIFRNSTGTAMKDDVLYFDFEEADWDFVE